MDFSLSEEQQLLKDSITTFVDKDYNFNALRLDTNRDFTKFQTGNLIGTITVSEPLDTLSQQ